MKNNQYVLVRFRRRNSKTTNSFWTASKTWVEDLDDAVLFSYMEATRMMRHMNNFGSGAITIMTKESLSER